ncbi:MAG: NUDIX domain-containing protein [Candidatus Woesearchaeota archaeon]
MADQKVGVGMGVLLLRNGKILLGKRHDDPIKADSALRGEGTWTMPGGKLHYGESFEEGAKREVMEETGIVLNSVQVLGVNNDKNEHAHFITLAMISEDFSGEAEVKEPDEITEWQWFDPKQLPKNLFFCSAEVMENFLQGEFYIPKR